MKYEMPDDCLVSIRSQVANSYNGTDVPIERLVHDNMRMKLADEIVTKSIKRTEEKFVTTYDLRVYVLTPNELAGMIQEEARNLMSFYPRIDFGKVEAA